MSLDAPKRGREEPSRRSASASIPEARRFEQLLAELCAALLRVPSEQIDREVEHWLKQIVLTLDLDRSTIGQVDSDTGRFLITYQWTRHGWQIAPVGYDISRDMPWYGKRVLAGEEVLFSSIEDLPSEAAVDIANFNQYLPKSNFTCPFKLEGRIVGAIAFGTLGKERSWPPLLLDRLRLVAHFFESALDRQHAAREIAKLQSELVYISRVSTMGELSAALAHELNQPLAAILNNAEALKSMLAADNPDFHEIRAAITDIIQDDTRAVETIHSMRELFRHGPPKKSELDLEETIGQVARLVQGDALIRNVAFTLHVESSLPKIFADRIQLQQVIVNLVLNAIEAVSKSAQGSQKVALRVRRGQDNSVEILVQDSGPGIAKEHISKVFQPFFSTKPGGLGMGLAISRSIIEAHGGSLSVSCKSSSGTVFTVMLPGAVSDGSLRAAAHAQLADNE